MFKVLSFFSERTLVASEFKLSALILMMVIHVDQSDIVIAQKARL
jgi:hypothetical protein